MGKRLSARRLPYALTAPLFKSMTRFLYPRTIEESMSWASELWRHHGMYAQAIRKAVRYFMTQVEVTGDADVTYSTRKSYAKILKDSFNILGEAAAVGDDCIGWGNAFTSIHIPFNRSLICSKCALLLNFKYAVEAGGFAFKNGEFMGTCPSCHKEVIYKVKDTQSDAAKNKLIVNRWPPQYMHIRKHPMSNRSSISMDIWDYDWLADGIRSGDPIFLEDTPMQILHSVMKQEPFEFEEDRIFHMKLPCPAAIDTDFKGWGMPLFMNEFEDAIRIVLLDRMNEAIMYDNSVPFKVLSPPPTAGSSQDGGGALDGMWGIGMDKFAASVKGMLSRHALNPTGWNFSPYPIQQQLLGGQAKDMVNVELMEHLEQRLLRAMGVPAEFYSGSLQNNAGPIIGLRMFEREWQFFAHALNEWITWLIRQQGQIMEWQKVSARLVPVSLYESPEDRQVVMELAGANKISNTTMFNKFNLDYEYESERIMDEQDEMNEKMQERQMKNQGNAENMQFTAPMSAAAQVQQQMQAQQQQQQGGAPQGQPPPGGAPQPSMGPNGATIDDLAYQAEQQAQQIMTMDPLSRRRTLADLKHKNEQLYNQVKGQLDKLENDAKMQGLQQARQPQQ